MRKIPEKYAVFHNEAGGDWAEITLLGTGEGLTAFVAWSCGLNTNDDDDSMVPVVFNDPLRGAPKAFKDPIGYCIPRPSMCYQHHYRKPI